MTKSFIPEQVEVSDDPLPAKYAVAEKEYYFLQSEIGRYDQISHGIKSWSTTVGFALVAAGFAQANAAIFLVSSAASLLFWITEARWKRYQKLHIERLKDVERFLHFGGVYGGPAVNSSFTNKLLASQKQWWREEYKVMLLHNVTLPHSVVFVTGIALFAMTLVGLIELRSLAQPGA